VRTSPSGPTLQLKSLSVCLVADADLLREKSEIFAILTTKVLGFSKMTTGRWASSK
jgi:hypothetical protein